MYLSISVLLMQPATENLWIAKSTTRRKNEPTKYSREKTSDPQILTKKYSDPRTSTRKNFGQTNTHKNTLDPRNIHGEKFRTQEILMRKNLGHSKYHMHEGTQALNACQHVKHVGT